MHTKDKQKLMHIQDTHKDKCKRSFLTNIWNKRRNVSHEINTKEAWKRYTQQLLSKVADQRYVQTLHKKIAYIKVSRIKIIYIQFCEEKLKHCLKTKSPIME